MDWIDKFNKLIIGGEPNGDGPENNDPDNQLHFSFEISFFGDEEVPDVLLFGKRKEDAATPPPPPVPEVRTPPSPQGAKPKQQPMKDMGPPISASEPVHSIEPHLFEYEYKMPSPLRLYEPSQYSCSISSDEDDEYVPEDYYPMPEANAAAATAAAAADATSSKKKKKKKPRRRMRSRNKAFKAASGDVAIDVLAMIVARRLIAKGADPDNEEEFCRTIAEVVAAMSATPCISEIISRDGNSFFDIAANLGDIIAAIELHTNAVFERAAARRAAEAAAAANNTKDEEEPPPLNDPHAERRRVLAELALGMRIEHVVSGWEQARATNVPPAEAFEMAEFLMQRDARSKENQSAAESTKLSAEPGDDELMWHLNEFGELVLNNGPPAAAPKMVDKNVGTDGDNYRFGQEEPKPETAESEPEPELNMSNFFAKLFEGLRRQAEEDAENDETEENEENEKNEATEKTDANGDKNEDDDMDVDVDEDEDDLKGDGWYQYGDFLVRNYRPMGTGKQ